MFRRKEKFDIIIEGGQSNAEGTGIGPVSKEYIPSEKILYLSARKEVAIREGEVHIEYMDTPFEIEIAQECIENGNIYGDFSLTFGESYISQGY